MKKYKRPLVILAVLCMLMLSSPIQAQEKPSWVPDNGFWVIVTNKHIKKDAIVQFYNNNDQLIYEERVIGKKFSLRKKRILFCLKECLDKALLSSASDLTGKKNWVISKLNKKQDINW